MTMTTMCAAVDCGARGQHRTTDCPGDECRGCLPRLAADGLLLCGWHLGRLERDALEVPRVYAALGEALAGGASTTGRVSGTPAAGLVINEAALDARAELRAVLAAWCRLIAEERGIRRPGRWRMPDRPPGWHGPLLPVWTVTDTVAAMGGYVARHHVWLAGTDYAADAAAELHAAAHGRARRIAWPSGDRRPTTIHCPVYGCAGWVRIHPHRDGEPSRMTCSVDEGHAWVAREWGDLARYLASPACGCGCHTGAAYRPPCTVPGGCGTAGCDGHGRLTAAAA